MALVEAEGVEGARFQVKTLGNLQRVLSQVGILVRSKARSRFRTQGQPPNSWPERMTPNVPGIVSDLNQGSNPPARRFQSRPAGIDTGRLSKDVNFRVSKNTLTVGSSLDYAGTINFGGTTRVVLRPVGRRQLWMWLQSLSRRKRRELGRELGWLFQKPEFNVRVRPRPFLTLTKEEVAEIEETVRAALERGTTRGSR